MELRCFAHDREDTEDRQEEELLLSVSSSSSTERFYSFVSPRVQRLRFSMKLLAALLSVLLLVLALRWASSDRERVSRIRVACVGDSITFGYHATNQSITSYPAQLQTLLGPGYTVMNFGRSGAMLSQAAPPGTDASKASFWTTGSFKASLQSQPDIVVILLGTNDATEETWPTVHDLFAETYAELISTYAGLASRPRVFIVVPPPLYVDGVYGGMIQEVINKVYPVLVPDIAIANHLPPAIDLFALFSRACPRLGPNETSCRWISGIGDFLGPPGSGHDDGCHPNDAGYRVIAKAIAASID